MLFVYILDNASLSTLPCWLFKGTENRMYGSPFGTWRRHKSASLTTGTSVFLAPMLRWLWFLWDTYWRNCQSVGSCSIKKLFPKNLNGCFYLMYRSVMLAISWQGQVSLFQVLMLMNTLLDIKVVRSFSFILRCCFLKNWRRLHVQKVSTCKRNLYCQFKGLGFYNL